MVLTVIAILGTHSRGALVGIVGMIVFFLLKTRRKFLPILIIAASIPFIPSIMPQHWFDRMHTIETYEQDGSATERLRAWGNAYELATQRPLTGGGYDVLIYWGGRDSHSIYFEVLAEHGFVGLALFLLLGFFTWRSATWIVRNTKRVAELKWASDLAAMLQVSMVGYGLAGAFLGLAYFDLIYCLIAVVVLTRKIVEKKLQETVTADNSLVDARQVGEIAPSTPASKTL
jgi:probable O-glycosylation ligase (exosortase A-associated)